MHGVGAEQRLPQIRSASRVPPVPTRAGLGSRGAAGSSPPGRPRLAAAALTSGGAALRPSSCGSRLRNRVDPGSGVEAARNPRPRDAGASQGSGGDASVCRAEARDAGTAAGSPGRVSLLFSGGAGHARPQTARPLNLR